MFSFVDYVLGQPPKFDNENDRWTWQENEIRSHLSFKDEDYINANRDLYISLAEHSTAEVLYGRFHAIVNNQHSFFSDTGLALTMFSRAVKQGGLKRVWIRIFLTRKEHEDLLSRVNSHWKLQQELNRSMEASGQLPRAPNQ